MMKKYWNILLCGMLMLSLLCPVFATESQTELDIAAKYVREHGIMTGDANGDLNLDSGLTRAELAVILTRMMGNAGNVEAEREYYAGQCKFEDVPEWARLYAGYCYVNGLMVGYENGAFGAGDKVNPAAACTVVLRSMELTDLDWNYNTACRTAIMLGLTPADAVQGTEISRGNLAIMLYRALSDTRMGGSGTDESDRTGLTRNDDGSINLPSDGSRYVPQNGDVIRCDDGANYTLTDVSRYDANMFAAGPVGPLPEPTCDWSLLEQPELPEATARHFQNNGDNYLYACNLYETRRMLYTLYNAIGDNPQTWENGAPKLNAKGIFPVYIYLTVPQNEDFQVFWPWRSSELVNYFNSVPPGKYHLQSWDVYCNGIFQRTEYQVYKTY